MQSVRVPAANTLVVSTERGSTVTKIVTPKVASVARDIFNCLALDGAEIENQVGGPVALITLVLIYQTDLPIWNAHLICQSGRPPVFRS